MNNLLIVLGVLFLALVVVVPLVERFGQPASAEKLQKYQMIFRILMAVMLLALLVRNFTGK